MPVPAASVVICSRDRHEHVAAAMRGLRKLTHAEGEHEIVLVDDGSRPPLGPQVTQGATVIRTDGLGLPSARNVGIRAAAGEVICFTDDDCLPDPAWVDAAVRFLREHRDHCGVQGPIVSEPWDPLYGHSLAYDVPQPGAYYGANIAYRRALLELEGGFEEQLNPYHGEDLDVAYRMLRHGPIGWAPAMRVRHHPRRLSFAEIVRRGRFARNEVLLHRRHAAHFGRGARVPSVLFPLVNVAHTWGVTLHAEGIAILGHPRRLARLMGLAVGQAWFTLKALVKP